MKNEGKFSTRNFLILIMICYTFLRSVEGLLKLMGILSPSSAYETRPDIVLFFLMHLILGICFIGIFRYKKWGAYGLVLTLLIFIAIFTWLDGLSIVFFLVVSLVSISVFSLTFIFSWQQMN